MPSPYPTPETCAHGHQAIMWDTYFDTVPCPLCAALEKLEETEWQLRIARGEVELRKPLYETKKV